MTDLVTVGFAFTVAPTTAGFAATAAGFVVVPIGSARLSMDVFAAALPVAGVMSTRFEAVSDDALPGAARLTPATGSGVGLLLGGDFTPGCCSLLAWLSAPPVTLLFIRSHMSWVSLLPFLLRLLIHLPNFVTSYVLAGNVSQRMSTLNLLAEYAEWIVIFAYLENQTSERPVIVILLDSINQELRERRHDLSVLAEPEIFVSKGRTAFNQPEHAEMRDILLTVP